MFTDASIFLRAWRTTVGGLTLICAGLAAHATPLVETYSLDATSVTQFGSGPFGSVTLTTSGANVNVEVDLVSGFDFVSTGNAGSHSLFAFDTTPGSGVSVSAILLDGTAGSYDISSPAGASPFGSFDYGLFCNTCRKGAPGKLTGPLTFTVENITLNSFAVRSGGLDGAYFAADLIGGGGSTGEVGAINSGNLTGSVPEPRALGLLALGAVLVGFARRSSKKTRHALVVAKTNSP
jgi:hypothetical protein